jgi:enoyl-CoA hydratase/carnithine racemase
MLYVNMIEASPHFLVENRERLTLICLQSGDGTNRLTCACVLALTEALRDMAAQPRALVITGNQRFFSAGADLGEIAALTGPAGYEFSKMGQALMNAIENFPAPVYAVINGYCMGGGLDLALACHRRIASRHASFGHRGAALGLVTGWGGTQRLSRLVGKARALEILAAAEKIDAGGALRFGLIDAIANDPFADAARSVRQIARWPVPSSPSE